MSLQPVPPGTRKGNKFYILRGRVDGKMREFRTIFPAGTSRKTLTAACAVYEQEIRADDAKAALKAHNNKCHYFTFAEAADAYIAFRAPSQEDIRNINNMLEEIGDLKVNEINNNHLIVAANKLYPKCAASSKNRQFMRPAITIMHYAAKIGWCEWLRGTPFPEPKPVTRAVADDIAERIIQTAPEGRKRLLILWLFRQGNRISDALTVTWEQISFDRQLVLQMRIGKKDAYRDKPLHPEIIAMLGTIPEDERSGRIFPWKKKSSVYNWLRPMVRENGIKFTPHMARHTLGTQLNIAQVGLKTIMEALDHDSVKSSLRYQTVDIELVRAALIKASAHGK